MARGTYPLIAAYLQARALEWMGEGAGRSARKLAALAGVSGPQIGAVLHEGKGVGWKTATGLGAVFGLGTMAEIEAAATLWAQAGHGRREPPLTMKAARSEHPRLRERPEWAACVEAARHECRYIPDRLFDQVGSWLDGPEHVRPLTPQLVGMFAHALFVDESRKAP